MTLSLINSKMNIQDLPSEILEKILVEGNFLYVSRVCQTWRDHSERKKSKFNKIFFDLTKDDPEKFEKNLDQLFILNSPAIDKNGFWAGPKIITSREECAAGFSLYLKSNYKKIIKKITFVNTLNFILDPLLYINRDQSPNYFDKYILSKNLFTDNDDRKVIGIINIYLTNFEDYLCILKNKIKNVNIEIKDVCNRIENIHPRIFFQLEINMLHRIIYYKSFEDFKKFTFNAPNNTYLIYDENKKILIIRFGNYEKYNFSLENKKISQDSYIYDTLHYKQYFVNSFTHRSHSTKRLFDYYPSMLAEYKYEKLTKKVEKLIIICSEFHEFMFDLFWEISNNQKDKKIEYHCLDPNKVKKIERENFEFVPVEKEQEYSFEQIHFKYFGEKVIF